jgi:hypothetical protein
LSGLPRATGKRNMEPVEIYALVTPMQNTRFPSLQPINRTITGGEARHCLARE